MDLIADLFNNRIIQIITVIVVSVTVYLIVNNVFNRIAKRASKAGHSTRRRATYFRLARNIVKYIIIILAIVSILAIFDVDVTSILVGLGVASVIAGLALQDALKDIITGFNIITDDYYAVGDVIEVSGTRGKVTELGLKSTKLTDIYDGSSIVIANRNINASQIISPQFDIDLPLPYELPLAKAEKLCNQIIAAVSDLKPIKKAAYLGPNEFADSAIEYKLRFWGDPALHPQIKRDANRIIKSQLDAAHIDIPYQQIDVHSKRT